MKTIDINHALSKMPQLLEMASNGAEILITKNDIPMVKLVTPYPRKKRPPLFGCDRGAIAITDDFDEPLEEFNDYL